MDCVDPPALRLARYVLGMKSKFVAGVTVVVLSTSACGSSDNESVKTTSDAETTGVATTASAISTGASQEADISAAPLSDEPATTSFTDLAAIPNVILKVTLGDDDGFWPYERTTSGPFTTTISEKNFELVDNFFETPSNKVSDDLIFYEAMIWMDSGVVTLYQFDNDYMPFTDMDGNVSDEEAFAYRESYAIMSFTEMPRVICDQVGVCEWRDFATEEDPDTIYADETSEFLEASFTELGMELAKRHPAAEFSLTFSGHGSPGGHLFSSFMHEGDSYRFLRSWTESIGAKLSIIDLGGPCNKASVADLLVFSPFSNYVIASDLPNGGYDPCWGGDCNFDMDLLKDEYQLFRIFASKDDTLEIAKEWVRVRRTKYELGRADIVRQGVQQANYVFESEAFTNLTEMLFETYPGLAGQPEPGRYADLLADLVAKGASQDLLNRLDKVIVFKVDNRDMFAWSEEANGLILNEDLQSVVENLAQMG